MHRTQGSLCHTMLTRPLLEKPGIQGHSPKGMASIKSRAGS